MGSLSRPFDRGHIAGLLSVSLFAAALRAVIDVVQAAAPGPAVALHTASPAIEVALNLPLEVSSRPAAEAAIFLNRAPWRPAAEAAIFLNRAPEPALGPRPARTRGRPTAQLQ